MTKVLVLGNATMDFVLKTARWPSAGETVLADTMTQSPGGKGLNQAVAAARLGAEVHFMAPIGKDANGEQVSAALHRERGIRPRWLMRDLPTDISTVWTSATGENMIVSSAECARSIDPGELEPVTALEEGDILLLQGNLRPDTSVAAARLARGRKASIFLNTAPIWWDMAEIISLSDVVISNEPEMRSLAGGTDLHAMEQTLRLGPRAVILTQGSEGAVLLERGASRHFPAPKVHAVDTAGAGDMAVGAIVASVLRGHGLPDAARYAMRLASLTVTRPGTLTSFPAFSKPEAFEAVDASSRNDSSLSS